MGNESDTPDDAQKRISRLERRLERERSARYEAEAIADRGMRELWLTNRALDERVAERTADLETTLQELEVASTSRERFLSVLSHEMRTPLNGVLGMLELLEPYTTGDQGASYLRAASESAAGLDNLVRRLLDLVELTTGSLTASLSDINADELAHDIQARWQMKALRTGHLLSLSSFLNGQTLHVDSGRVHQIVDEILENALAYATPGGIEVRLQPSGDQVVIEVQDSGPGITAEYLKQVFESLDHADMSTSRATQGLGLGLALSQRIAHALGGALTIDSSTADGDSWTIARLTMPAGLNGLAAQLPAA